MTCLINIGRIFLLISSRLSVHPHTQMKQREICLGYLCGTSCSEVLARRLESFWLNLTITDNFREALQTRVSALVSSLNY